MPWSEIVFGSLLVALLLVLSLAYGRRQWQALHRLRQGSALPEEELAYERRKARRRLASCALLLLLAGLLVTLLAVFGDRAQQMADQSDALGPAAAVEGLSESDKVFLRLWGATLIAFLLALLALLVLAGLDLMETRRYGLRQYRKLQAERRAMIQRQSLRLREQRQGEE